MAQEFESVWRYSILLRRVVRFSSDCVGMIDIGTSTIGARLVAIVADRLNIDNKIPNRLMNANS